MNSCLGFSWRAWIAAWALIPLGLSDAAAALSKGQLILLERGLQLQGMVTTGDVFHLDTYAGAHYTSVHWLWDGDPARLGASPGYPWSRWVGDESKMPPLAGEEPYLDQLVSLQLGDELHLNDPAVRQRAVNWFRAVRTNFPKTIVYMNNYGGQVGDAELADYVSRAQPDMLAFDHYPWREDYSSRTPISGPPVSWYSELRRYREHARAANIPLAVYAQTFHAVQDYDRTVYRDPGGSELRLNIFGALAFNAKVLIDFTYNTGASSLFTKPGGDSYPTALFAEKADANGRARHLGRALVRLKPIDDPEAGYTTSILFIRGKNGSGAVNPIPISFRADPEALNGYTDWVANRNDPYLRGWVVTNKGTKNNGFAGDVLIAWFKPLDETFDGPNHSGEVYLMVVNGLTDPTGSAADCLQEVKLNFAFPAGLSAVDQLDAATGLVRTQTLPIVSSRRQLVLALNGGDAALFKFSTGAPFVGDIKPARLNLRIESDRPEVRLEGTVSGWYELQTASSLSTGIWRPFTNLVLLESPSVFFDAPASRSPMRVYRAVGVHQ